MRARPSCPSGFTTTEAESAVVREELGRIVARTPVTGEETIRDLMKGWRESFYAGSLRAEVNHYPRMSALCATFPTLRGAPGSGTDRTGAVSGCFCARELELWARGPAGTSGLWAAAQFALLVFNPTVLWRLGAFNVVTAMQNWDSNHREAFARWAADPFWA